jgi:hypothetical protein
MQRYLVSAASKDNRLVALLDSGGRHHLAHCTSDLPAVNTRLSGAAPAVGFALMIGPDDDACRLIFSHINCSLPWALDRVHAVHVPGRFQRGPGAPLAHAGAE